MDELIVKKLRGEATDLEVRRLERWRSASPGNERDYRTFKNLWDASGEPEKPVVRPAPAVETILRLGDARRAKGRAHRPWEALARWPRAGYGLAAAAVVTLVFLALPWRAGWESSTEGLFPVGSSSGSGDITTLSLSDGSVVRATPGTRVDIPSSPGRREVVVEGKAFFAVAADPTPFVVRTAVGEVTVYGTRFEILTDGDELRVVVVEGIVRLSGRAGVADVEAGQVAYLGLSSSPRVVDPADVWDLLEWADGLLIFEGTPLSEVADELGRHFGRNVIIEDETLRQVRITAWFEDEPIEGVVSAVCLLAVADCEVGAVDVRIGL